MNRKAVDDRPLQTFVLMDDKSAQVFSALLSTNLVTPTEVVLVVLTKYNFNKISNQDIVKYTIHLLGYASSYMVRIVIRARNDLNGNASKSSIIRNTTIDKKWIKKITFRIEFVYERCSDTS